MGKEIAKWLGISEWNKYTGHWKRRMAITLAAEVMSREQIKLSSGHSSDAAVEVYIAQSKRHLQLSGDAIALNRHLRGQDGLLPPEHNTRTILPQPVPLTLAERPTNHRHETGENMEKRLHKKWKKRYEEGKERAQKTKKRS